MEEDAFCVCVSVCSPHLTPLRGDVWNRKVLWCGVQDPLVIYNTCAVCYSIKRLMWGPKNLQHVSGNRVNLILA